MKVSTLIFLIFFNLEAVANVYQTLTKELPPTDSVERKTFFKATDISIEDENHINNMAPLAFGMTQMISNANQKYSKNHEYSEASIKKLSTIIDNALPLTGRHTLLPTVWGYFLGNTLVNSSNGQWKKMGDGTFAILLPNGEFIFPINEAYKHAGSEGKNSILDVYKSVGLKLQAYEESLSNDGPAKP